MLFGIAVNWRRHVFVDGMDRVITWP